MDLILTRNEKNKYGIFSTLQSGMGVLCHTLEHAYPKGEEWEPKLQPGTYKCVRGMHKLEHGKPFETFEVTGVEGHSGILFHVGNTNADSCGCLCVGAKQFEFVGDGVFIPVAVVRSKANFETFLSTMRDCNEFQLTVV